jgi:multisubunit Na+/H+ antiporter MnhB subunit
VSSPLIDAAARLLFAPALLVAAAVIVKGFQGTGDGFSAGAIVGLAVLLLYVALGAERVETLMPVVRRAPAVAAAGVLLALAVAVSGLITRGEPLAHVPGPGEDVSKVGSIELMTPVVFDIGVFLLVVGTVVGALRLVAVTHRETGA